MERKSEVKETKPHSVLITDLQGSTEAGGIAAR